VKPTGRGLIPKRIGLALSVVLFGVPAVLLWLVTRYLVPTLVTQGWEPLPAWFLGGGLLLALLMAAALTGATMALPAPSWRAILDALRVHSLSPADWRLGGLTLLVTLAAVAAMQFVNVTIGPGLAPHPHFMHVEPLGPAQRYILALWLPFFFLNIVGEELWWRGFIQPRQEPVFGHRTWIVQGLLHGAFHVSFGLGVLFVVWPILFSIPWAVQRTRNTSVGILIHAGANGPAFLAVTLGLLPS
jgi:membrane protease YdiL (CAAX protease family)